MHVCMLAAGMMLHIEQVTRGSLPAIGVPSLSCDSQAANHYILSV